MKTIKLLNNHKKHDSFFADGTRLYLITDKGSLILISQNRCNNLFNFLYNNWDKIMIEYSLYNQGNKFPKPLNWFINDDRLIQISRGLTGITNTMEIGFTKYHKIIRIMNQNEYLIQKRQQINDLELRCKAANFAPYDDRVPVGEEKEFVWDEHTIEIAENWLKSHYPDGSEKPKTLDEIIHD